MTVSFPEDYIFVRKWRRRARSHRREEVGTRGDLHCNPLPHVGGYLGQGWWPPLTSSHSHDG